MNRYKIIGLNLQTGEITVLWYSNQYNEGIEKTIVLPVDETGAYLSSKYLTEYINMQSPNSDEFKRKVDIRNATVPTELLSVAYNEKPRLLNAWDIFDDVYAPLNTTSL
jgi:hypothetical protein